MGTGSRVAVLASGSGSNLQALIDSDLGPAHLALVVVNVAGAGALSRAHKAEIPTRLLEHQRFANRGAFEKALLQVLGEAGIDWVVLAGFMRILGTDVVRAFPDRILNIHPSLLPAFPGMDAQAQALKAGVRLTGCSVHLVDSGVDTGPILAQTAVPVLPDDSLDVLRRRILTQEHLLLPAVVRAVAEGHLRENEQGQPYLEGFETRPGATLSNPRLALFPT